MKDTIYNNCKNIKYHRINLTKYMQNLSAKKPYKTLLRKIK